MCVFFLLVKGLAQGNYTFIWERFLALSYKGKLYFLLSDHGYNHNGYSGDYLYCGYKTCLVETWHIRRESLVKSRV